MTIFKHMYSPAHSMDFWAIASETIACFRSLFLGNRCAILPLEANRYFSTGFIRECAALSYRDCRTAIYYVFCS